MPPRMGVVRVGGARGAVRGDQRQLTASLEPRAPPSGVLRLTHANRLNSMRCRWPRMAPLVQFAAAPGHSPNPYSNWARKPLLSHEPVNRGSAQAGHLNDRRHAQKNGSGLIVCSKRWGGWLVHGNPSELAMG